MIEQPTTGTPKHPFFSTRDAGMKFDAGKPMAGLMVSDFANALLAVSEVSTFGAKKYAPHSWATVPNARDRYNDALYRHLFLAAAGEAQDLAKAVMDALTQCGWFWGDDAHVAVLTAAKLYADSGTGAMVEIKEVAA